jgi:hypothetical protein
MKKRLVYAFTIIGALMSLGAGAYLYRLDSQERPAEEIALAALESDEFVAVTQGEWIVFTPLQSEPTTGFIFYPGALVDPRAYAPALRQIAAAGYLVVDVPMPFNVATWGVERAAEVMAAFPEIERWVIGGHSLGGAVAARFVFNHPGEVDRLILWAGVPSRRNELSTADLDVLSIYATLDGLIRQRAIDFSRDRLPGDTVFVAIEGGNHAQFGYYGAQEGDNPATISQEDQQAQIIEATLGFLAGYK